MVIITACSSGLSGGYASGRTFLIPVNVTNILNPLLCLSSIFTCGTTAGTGWPVVNRRQIRVAEINMGAAQLTFHSQLPIS
jgi:hypothetical protein